MKKFLELIRELIKVAGPKVNYISICWVGQNVHLGFPWYCCCSVTKSCLTLCEPMDCSTPGFPVLHYVPGVCSNSCPLSWWCYLTILSSASSFSFCLQSLPASVSFPMSQLFTSGGEVLELHQQSFHSIFKVDFLLDWLVWSPCSSRGSQESSLAL